MTNIFTPENPTFVEFYKIDFFKNVCKIHRKTPVPDSLFTVLSPATLRKENTPIQVFSEKCWRYLRHLFYRTAPGDCLWKNILPIK